MENQDSLVAPLFEKIQEYGKTTYELTKLKTIDKIARFLSGAVTRIITYLVLLMCVLFLSVALALWAGSLLGAMYLGFLCVSGVYAIFGVVLAFILKKGIKTRVADAVVEDMLND